MEDFKDKVAVVTGGASGVGFAIGEALAKEGAKVVLTDIEESKLKAAKEELSSYGDLISVKQADVSNPKSMDNLKHSEVWKYYEVCVYRFLKFL